MIESQAPVRQPGEVAEGLADGVAIAMGAVPAPDEEDGHEDVERYEAAENSVGEGREEPGGFEAVLTVEGGVCAQHAGERAGFAHFGEYLHLGSVLVVVPSVFVPPSLWGFFFLLGF